MRNRMALLKPEDLEKTRRRQITNILAKQASGKTISAREERALAEAASDTPPGLSNFVASYDELAQRLSVSRKTLQNACKRFPDTFPVPRADGRHDVTAWLNFFTANNIAKTAEIGSDDQPVTIADWKAKELELKCQALELSIAETNRRVIPADEIRDKLQVVFSSLRTTLNNVPARAAAKVIGLTDYHEVETLLQNEINICLRTIADARFLDANDDSPVPTAPQSDTPTRPPTPTRPRSKRPAKPKAPPKNHRQPRQPNGQPAPSVRPSTSRRKRQ